MDRKLISRRRLIQLYSALLMNAHIKGFIKGDIYTGPLKNMCVPGLNCYSCPGATGACPLGALQNALASSDRRAPFFIIGIIMLTGLILGRTVCGYVCPFGLIQELLHRIPVPKIRKGRVTRALSYLKYIILAVFVVYIPLSCAVASGLPVPAFCKYICPVGTLEGAVGLLSNPANEAKLSMLNILFTRKFIILAAVVCACMFIHRFFCRFLCPLGALYGCFNRLALAGLSTDYSKCSACGLCVSVCEMDIRRVGDRECVQCGKCASVCPEKAISFKGGRFFLKPPEVSAPPRKARRPRLIKAACAVLALALLAAELWYVNRPDAPLPEAVVSADEDIPTGKETGQRCPDFTAPLYGEGGEFTLSDFRGRPVVINFWATWCAPCCAELPYFELLHRNYPGIEIIALHSNLVTDDVQAYLDGQAYSFYFGHDVSGGIIASLGGSVMLPMTVVLDADGRIAYNAVGSVTYEKLEGLVLPLIENGGN